MIDLRSLRPLLLASLLLAPSLSAQQKPSTPDQTPSSTAPTIRYVDKDTNRPLTLGLLVDTSLSQRDVIDEERTASSTFLDQMLTTPKDKAFIMQFAAETELLQDLTSSRPLLQAALKEIDTPSPDSSNDSGGSRRGG